MKTRSHISYLSESKHTYEKTILHDNSFPHTHIDQFVNKCSIYGRVKVYKMMLGTTLFTHSTARKSIN